MHILVIGGAGYIGSHVVLDLLQKGHKVTVFDNLSTGQTVNLQPQAAFIQGDICRFEEIERAFALKPDAAVLLAGKKSVGESMEKPEFYAQTNIQGMLCVLNAMLKNNIKKLVFSSSSSVYGQPAYTPIDENHPLSPLSFYGFTKLETERFLKWYSDLKGLKFVALRYFNAVGYDKDGQIKGMEKNPQNLLPLIMEVLTGKREKLLVFGNDYETTDGTCIRDYIHVSDLADAHTKALNYLEEGKESIILNLGTEKGISVLEMIKAVEEITGKKVPFEFAPRREGDAPVSLASCKSAKEKLGWQATQSSLENIIRTTWKMYKNL